MEREEVEKLTQTGLFRGQRLNGKLMQTHSSWVILSGRNAFKIKKPVKYSFLDFSTLEYRREACLRELFLNNRFSDIYYSVLPVSYIDGSWNLDQPSEAIVDYAVWMKRMASYKQMDRLLERQKVRPQDIGTLSRTVSSLHKSAKVVKEPFDLDAADQTFRDLLTIEQYVRENMEGEFTMLPKLSIQWNTAFLGRHAKRLQERIDHGFKREVHGDLHSGNIFLYRKPVLFDCIEFNDHFRQIDVLDEVSFLCMDMESFGAHQLADYFLEEYCRFMPCMPQEEDHLIFIYFKCLRANIRAKIQALSAQQTLDAEQKNYHLTKVRRYFELIDSYILMGNS